MPLTPDPHISVTLWSRIPVHPSRYMPVTLETMAILDERQVLLVLTRQGSMRMAVHLTEDGLKELTRQLTAITRRFRAHTKENTR